jgi:hypothetical protein
LILPACLIEVFIDGNAVASAFKSPNDYGVGNRMDSEYIAVTSGTVIDDPKLVNTPQVDYLIVTGA